MSGTPRELGERTDQEEPEGKRLTRDEFNHELFREFAHEVRGDLNVIGLAAANVRVVPPSSPAFEKLITKIQESPQRIKQKLENIVDELPSPHSYADVHGMISGLLPEILENVRHEDEMCEMPNVHMEPLPLERAACEIPANRTGWIRTLENLIKNARRFRAKNVRIRLGNDIVKVRTEEGKEFPGLQISIEDDGPGIAPETLRKILAGDPTATTREQEGTLPEGHTPKQHGHGLPSVRRFIHKCRGEFCVETNTDPDDHWTRIIFRLPVINGHKHHAETPAEPAAAASRPEEAAASTAEIYRREALILLMGSIAITAASVLGKRETETPKQPPEPERAALPPRSPLRDLQVDEKGIVRFTCNLGGKLAKYQRGVPNPDFLNAHAINTPGHSSVVCEVMINGARRHVIISHFPEGMFGYVHTMHQGSLRTGYLCALRQGQEPVALDKEPLVDLPDTVYTAGGERLPTNVAFLRGAKLTTLAPALENVQQILPAGTYPEQRATNVLKRITQQLLTLRNLAENAENVATVPAWQKALAEAQQSGLSIGSNVQDHLQAVPRAPLEIAKLHGRGNTLFFPKTDLGKVNALIKR